jgi:hypothetical protein
MMQQPNIDTESPVTVLAEFDPPVLSVGERSTYRLVVTAMHGSIQMPDALPSTPGLGLEPGGHAETYVHIGSKLQPRTTFLFHARATTNGNYAIAPFTISAYGKPITVPACQVTFLPLSSPSPLPALRLIIQLPPGDLYVGQSVPIRLVLIDPGNGTAQGLATPQILSEAFIPDPAPHRYSRELVNFLDQPRQAFVSELVITPIKEGEHAMLAQGQAILLPTGPNPSVRTQIDNRLVDSDPLTVRVQSLPKEGQLPGFTGAIGEFQLDPPQVSTNVIRAGEPVLLMVTIRGNGNFSRLTPPKPAAVPGWQVFSPLMDSPVAYQGLLQASRSYVYTLIALSDRIQGTPSIAFSYFNPQTKQYVDLTIPPVRVKVLPAPSSSNVVALDPSAETLRTGSEEMDHQEKELLLTGLAETPGRAHLSLRPAQQSAWFFLLQLLPAATLAGLLARDRYRRFLAEHPEVLLKRRARKGLRRQLKLLRKSHANGDPEAFALAGVQALQEICAPFSTAHPGALACNDVLPLIPSETDSARNAEIVRTLFAAADAHRFNHQTQCSTDLLALRTELERLLATFQRQL